MALVRVFVLTYRRPELLRRALASLRAQTLTDWVCELHNDDPADPAPARLVRELDDPRISCVTHEANWGAVRTFRRAYQGGPEPFAAVLEDDNWWDPELLARLHAALAAAPDCALAWANMRFCEEQADGSWRDTGRCIWPPRPPGSIHRFDGLQLLQAFDALHSHGAMLFRPDPAAIPPAETPLAIIEPVRERAISGPLLLLAEPLATFAITRGTSRSVDRSHWLASQLLVATSFFGCVPLDATAIARLWRRAREDRPPWTGLLLLAGIAGAAPRGFFRPARAADWARLAAHVCRRPGVHLRALRFRRRFPAVWAFLAAATPRRAGTGAGPLIAKADLPPSANPV